MAEATPGIELVLQALARATPVEASSAEIQQLARLADGGREREAAARAATQLRAGCTDVRVLAAFMRALFFRLGPLALADVLQALARVLGDGWDVLTPVKGRERAAHGALRAMLRHIVTYWDFDLAAKGEKPWTWPSPDRERLGVALETSAALRSLAERRGLGPGLGEQLSELDAHLRTALDRAVRLPTPSPAAPLPEPEPEPESEPESEPGSEPEPEALAPAPATPPASTADAPPALDAAPAPSSRGLELSNAMRSLLQKFAAFERLIRRGEELRAAIVASDIQDLLGAFDPRVYFPQLLAPHFALRVEHRAALLPHLDEKGSSEWRELEQLYHVDLNAFLGP
jgi:hypothetical protein